MKHSKEEQAGRLYRRTFFVALLALSILGQLGVLGVLWVAQWLTGQKLMGGGFNTGGLTIVWMLGACFIAAWRVRRAGLSREAHVIEFFHGAGVQARQALRGSAPFEVRSQPSKPRRVATYVFSAIFMAAMSWGAWWMLHDSRTPVLYKLILPLGLVLLPTLGLACLFQLAFDWPEFRADARGIRASHGLWFRTVRWEQVHSVEFLTIHNVMGELALIQPQFKNASGKVLLLLNLAPILGYSIEARQSIITFLRAACSEPDSEPMASEIRS